MKPFQLPALVASLLLLANAAHAATAFASRTAFDATFPGATIENWDSNAHGTVIVNGTTLNGITYNLNNLSIQNLIVTNFFGSSTNPNVLGVERPPLDPASRDEFFFLQDTITFSFGTSLLAFGIDLTTVATLNGSYQLTTNTGEVINSVFNAFPGLSTGQFAGFSSAVPFTSVTVSAASFTTAGYALDTLRYVPVASQSIPEGGITLVLLGSAVGALLGIRRKLS